MEIKVYHSESIPFSVYQSVSDLLHDSFEERKSQGMDIKWGSYSPDDVENSLQIGGVNRAIYF